MKQQTQELLKIGVTQRDGHLIGAYRRKEIDLIP